MKPSLPSSSYEELTLFCFCFCFPPPKHHNRLSLTRHWHPQVKLSCRGPARLSTQNLSEIPGSEKRLYNSIEPSPPSSHGLLTLFCCFLLFEAQQQTWPDLTSCWQPKAKLSGRDGWQNLSHLHTPVGFEETQKPFLEVPDQYTIKQASYITPGLVAGWWSWSWSWSITFDYKPKNS
jgi:hypothetical protein